MFENGKYEFYAVDVAGNIGTTLTITLDNIAPAAAIMTASGEGVSGTTSNSAYVTFSATDATSGIAALYVRLPDKATFSEYAGERLTDEGVYSFYAVDVAGNRSEEIGITLDRTAPVGKITSGKTELPNNGYTNVFVQCNRRERHHQARIQNSGRRMAKLCARHGDFGGKR